ncbi:hypothetical protein RB597_005590 [Gaeumannomyces tritici]
MQSMQRSFGRLLNKAPGDNAKVSVMLSDFEDADKILLKIIDSAKSWRDSWIALASTQLGVATEYEGLYDPIVGATDGHGKDMSPTPAHQLQRTLRLCEVYRELKDEIVEEAAQIEARVIRPATDARDCIQPIRKTIKKRENKRLDYEKQQDKVNKLARKPSRTPKEDTQLARAQEDMATLAEEFHVADSHLRDTLPHIVNAVFSMIPPLLGCHILVQNKLLGLYYTFLNGYCEEQGFPSPPPPMEQVIADWTAGFDPIKHEIESIGCVSRGKAISMSMRMPEDQSGTIPQARRLAAPPPTNEGIRRTSTGLIPKTSSSNLNGGGGGRLMRIPSAPAPPPEPAAAAPRPGFAGGAHMRPTDFTQATSLGQEPASAPAVVRPRIAAAPSDYFGHGTGGGGSGTTTPGSTARGPIGAVIAAKKKPPPPPPPPPKRIPAANKPPEEFVVALYAFAGQGKGDLSFNVGDRIKIIKKTNTADDWWEGEIGGTRGSFPANYCQAA